MDQTVRLKPKLDTLSDQWNFDLSDCDRILRVKIRHEGDARIIQTVICAAGFTCEELTD